MVELSLCAALAQTLECKLIFCDLDKADVQSIPVETTLVHHLDVTVVELVEQSFSARVVSDALSVLGHVEQLFI